MCIFAHCQTLFCKFAQNVYIKLQHIAQKNRPGGRLGREYEEAKKARTDSPGHSDHVRGTNSNCA